MKRAAPEEPELDDLPLFPREVLELTPRSIDANVSLSPDMADAIRGGMFPGLAVREAEKRRDEGMSNALANADARDAAWRPRFLDTVHEMALTLEFFLSEDVLKRCPAPSLSCGKAAGPLMREARKLGYVEPAGYAPAETSNGSGKVRWRSLLLGKVAS